MIKTLSIALLLTASFALPAQAQEWPSMERLETPDVPELLKPLEEKGAQIRFIGEEDGFNGWIVFDKGRPNFTYSTQDGELYFQGMMFNKDGENLTMRQLQDFRLREGEDSFDTFNEISRMMQERDRNERAAEATKQITQNLQNTETMPSQPTPAETREEMPQSQGRDMQAQAASSASREPETPVTKSDRLMQDLTQSNWVSFGSAAQPEIYAMIDPGCSHCRETMRAFRPYLESGALEMRVMPVGFNAETKRIGALMLAAGDPQGLYYSYIDGDLPDLGKSRNVSIQGVDRNLMTVNTWGFDVTPMLFYRNAQGEVKIIRGVPGNIDLVMNDLKG